MNCHQLRDALIDRARGALAGTGSIAAVESHLEHCAACAAEYARQRALSGALRALAAASERQEASSELQQRVIQTFARDCAGPPSRPTSRNAIVATLAVAASLMLVVSAVIRSGSRAATRVGPEDSPEPVAAAAAPKPIVPNPDRWTPAAADDMVSKSHAPSRPRPAGATSEARQKPVATLPGTSLDEFMPLPGAVGLPAFESGRVVRVDLPVSSLPAYGVDLAPDAARSEVQAEVLVGQDGQPRAIRLVSEGHER
jgi:anti-sigma factor RsiW